MIQRHGGGNMSNKNKNHYNSTSERVVENLVEDIVEESTEVKEVEKKEETKKLNEFEKPAPFVVKVTAARLNIRASASTKSTVIKVVNKGDILTVERTKNPEWLRVARPNGFVMAEFVK